MFGKLLKYEFRYLIRIFGPMWALVLGLSLVSRLFVPKDADRFMELMVDDPTGATVVSILITIMVTAMFAMMAVMAVVLIQRFYKGMFGDEGYLMFTLPVTSGQLINAKMLGALVMSLGTTLVLLLSLGVLLFYPDLWEMLGAEFFFVWEEFEAEQLGILLSGFWLIVTAIVSTITGLYMVYLAMTLGQLWRKHPVAGAILAYYAMTIVLSSLSGVGTAIFGYSLTELVVDLVDAGPATLMTVTCLVQIVQSAVMGAVYFFVTKWLLDQKLDMALAQIVCGRRTASRFSCVDCTAKNDDAESFHARSRKLIKESQIY